MTFAVAGLEELEHHLRGFAAAYPESVFTPLSDEDERKLSISGVNAPIDRISASMGRHFRKWFLQAADAIASLRAENESLEREGEALRNEGGAAESGTTLEIFGEPVAMTHRIANEIKRLRAESERKDALAKELSDTLIKVRPLGGSELFKRVGEQFYADPKFCGAVIEAMHSDLHRLRTQLAQPRNVDEAVAKP